MSMSVFAIDPGPTESAYVMFDGVRPTEFAKIGNEEMLYRCGLNWADGTVLVIEQVAAMGMAVGAETFETVFWSGRFAERWHREWHRVKRHEVKIHLCGNMRAKDANIRQALLDRYGPGKELAIGCKKKPGPLHGLSGDCWSALAIAHTYFETRIAKEVA
jgi:hypothetical protein